MSLDCVIYCAFYSILFRGGVFSRTRCISGCTKSNMAAGRHLGTFSGMGRTINLCLVLVYGFQSRQIEWHYFQCNQIQDGGHDMTWHVRSDNGRAMSPFAKLMLSLFLSRDSGVGRSRPSMVPLYGVSRPSLLSVALMLCCVRLSPSSVTLYIVS